MSSIAFQPNETDEARTERRAAMARALARGGMSGVHVVSLETAEEILTPKRVEILSHLRDTDVESVSELARQLDRDKAQVSRDLGILAEHSLITYDDGGRAKTPKLTQEHLVVEPLY